MEERPGKPWHRDGLPPWAWGFLAVSRVIAVLAALVPLAIAFGAWWWWTHPPGNGRATLARWRPHAEKSIDSLAVVADSLAARLRGPSSPRKERR